MKTKLCTRTWAKVLAAVFLALSLLAGGASAAGTAACKGLDFYTQTPDSYYESWLYTNRCSDLAREIANTVHYGGETQAEQVLEDYYTQSNTNAYIQVYNSRGVCILTNEPPEKIVTRSVREYTFGYEAGDNGITEYADTYSYETGAYEVWEGTGRADEITVRISLASPQTADDGFAQSRRTFDRLYDARFVFAAAAAVSALLAVGCTVFLFCGAGRRAGVEGVVLSPLDRVPLDLLALGALLLLGLAADSWQAIPFLAVCVLLGFLLALSFAVRCKAKCLWSTMLVSKIWKLLVRAARAAGRGLRRAYRALPLLGKSAVVILAAALLEVLLFLAAFSGGSALFFLLFVLYNLALLALVLFGVLQMKRLREAGQKLAGGNFDYKVDTSRMYWEFRRHGENLNSIGAGMAIAVEQRMKSERLKTELITNVSHDIKTPLTSIINYTDLLQRPELTEAERKEYLEVLGRQSRRLKKLTEDLVEASKASTGNIQASLSPTNVEELINQAVAEYAERLQAGRLEPVVTVERGDLTALADGRLLWRILDNLLGNVVKYALAGTRVYLDARMDGDRVCISVKNISREPLNISADELMERFVRGDASRTTEGSGLGLNIARSLTTLQQGTFDITVDGDLFRADIRLKPGEA